MHQAHWLYDQSSGKVQPDSLKFRHGAYNIHLPPLVVTLTEVYWLDYATDTSRKASEYSNDSLSTVNEAFSDKSNILNFLSIPCIKNCPPFKQLGENQYLIILIKQLSVIFKH